jgi:hypothetical protein
MQGYGRGVTDAKATVAGSRPLVRFGDPRRISTAGFGNLDSGLNEFSSLKSVKLRAQS